MIWSWNVDCYANEYEYNDELKKENGTLPGPDPDSTMALAQINSRYAFLLIVFSIESAANAMLNLLNYNKDLYQENEEKKAMHKFKLFCKFYDRNLDKGNHHLGNINSIFDRRDAFVHPKPSIIRYEVKDDNGIEYNLKCFGQRKYPCYFLELTPNHVLYALHDTLAFLSYIMFDICKFNLIEGSKLLGLNSLGYTADILDLQEFGEKLNLQFDFRTFGRET